MKESFWGYLLVSFGVAVIVIMMIIRDYQTANDNDYYIMKETLQDAMIDSVDYAYWREFGELKIIEEKFVENYLRRFAHSMSSNKNYKIQFYNIIETPPKASIKVTTATGDYKVVESDDITNFAVVTLMSGILDTKDRDFYYGVGSSGENTNKYVIHVSVENGVVSSGEESQIVNQGSNINITTLPNEGYSYDSSYYSCSGTATTSMNNGVLSFRNVKSDMECTVIYKEMSIVTMSVTNGTTNKTSQKIRNNSSATFTVEPKSSEYKYEGSCSCSTGGTCSYNTSNKKVTVSNVTSSTTCSVVFRREYTVNLSVTNGTPRSTSAKVLSGLSTTFNITPTNTSYTDGSITCNDSTATADYTNGVATVSNVNGNISCQLSLSIHQNYHANDVILESGYTGEELEVELKDPGYYKFEVWGAQGEDYVDLDTGTIIANGGKGGYAYGNYRVLNRAKVYVNVGGTNKEYNGGHSSEANSKTGIRSCKIGSGGATHIALSSGQLSDLKYMYSRDYNYDVNGVILIVAGGGGGGGQNKTYDGGGGGGSAGNDGIGEIDLIPTYKYLYFSYIYKNRCSRYYSDNDSFYYYCAYYYGFGANQNASGRAPTDLIGTNYNYASFGNGGAQVYSACGGGGYYGGEAGGYGGGDYYGGGGGGGSGFVRITNDRLNSNSNISSTLVRNTTGMETGVKKGDGRVKITYLG